MSLHYMQIVTGNCGCCIVWAENGRHIQIIVQDQVKHRSQAYVMVPECVRGHGTPNLFICKGTIYAEGLKKRMLSSRWHVFRSVPAYSSKALPSHILPLLQQCGFVVKDPDCLLIDQTCPTLKICGASWNEKFDHFDPGVWSNWSWISKHVWKMVMS